MTAFVTDHRNRFGVEPICRVLSEHGCTIAPSTYYAAINRKPSQRALSDAALWERIEAIEADPKKGRGMAGYRKMWHLLKRDGVDAAPCTVARLMREHGMKGVVRGKKFVTTRADESALRPADHVKRDFTAERPDQLWIVDFTYVPTWAGMGFTAFVKDAYSRRLVGWRSSPDADRTAPGRLGDGVVGPRPGRAQRDRCGATDGSTQGSSMLP